MFAQLGEIQFEGLTAPSTWSESHATTYAEVAHVGGKPSMQRTAEALVVVDLTIRLSQDFCNVADVLDKLKKAKTAGEVLPLISGAGVMMGKFVITAIDNEVQQTTHEGELIAAKLDISLKEYVTPPGSEQPSQGEAMKSKAPMKQPPAKPVTTEPQAIAKDISKAQRYVKKIKSGVQAVRSGTQSIKKGIRDAKRMADTARLLYTEASAKVRLAKKIAKRAAKLPTSLDEAIAYADNLARIDNLANVSMLEKQTEQLSEASEKVAKDAAPVMALVGTREGGS